MSSEEPERAPAPEGETATLLLDVAVRDLSGEAALRQGFLDLFAEHDGTVFAASAAEGNRQNSFCLM
jgi:hypothetical protein